MTNLWTTCASRYAPPLDLPYNWLVLIAERARAYRVFSTKTREKMADAGAELKQVQHAVGDMAKDAANAVRACSE